jgi:phospholipid/cholesterol/gamma-HCH transport system substrate-binding protein
MARRIDEVRVGMMVVGVGAILTLTVFLVMHYNPFQPPYDEYKISLKYAGGLEKDSIVRFGGMKRGKVVSVQLAPGNASTVEIVLSLERGTPVRESSIARLAALSALGENYVEISPGREDAMPLKPGQTIRSEETPEFTEVLAQLGDLSMDAKRLIGDIDKNLNRISDGANSLLANLNDATGAKNREALASILDGANGVIFNANDLLARSSPKINAIAANLDSATEKIPPLMQRIDEATSRMNTLFEHLDDTVAENRSQVKKDLETVESTLAEARHLIGDFASTMETNRNDIDAMVENFRRSSESLQEFTNMIKQRPFSLVRIKPLPDRKVSK